MDRKDKSPFTEGSDFYKSEKWIAFRKWYWLLCFFLVIIFSGIIILIWPKALYQTLSYLMGGSLMIAGIYKIFFEKFYQKYYLYQRSGKNFPWFGNLAIIILALALLLNPGLFIVVLPIIFGFMVLFLSLFLLALTRSLSGTRMTRSLLIAGIAFFIISVFIFVYPKIWGGILGRVMGFILIGIGVGGIVLSLYLRKMEWNITSLYNNFKNSFHSRDLE